MNEALGTGERRGASLASLSAAGSLFADEKLPQSLASVAGSAVRAAVNDKIKSFAFVDNKNRTILKLIWSPVILTMRILN